MTGISESQLNELISITLVDMPMPSVADLLCAGGEWAEWEVAIIVEFIKKRYTKDEILAGVDEYLKRCKFVSELFCKDKDG